MPRPAHWGLVLFFLVPSMCEWWISTAFANVPLPFSGTSNTTRCVFSITNTGRGYAICGVTNAALKAGVFGQNKYPGTSTEFDSPAYGVEGQAPGRTGRGVYGAGGAYGVFGTSRAVGVSGISTGSGDGVRGESNEGVGIHGMGRSVSAGVAAENLRETAPALEIRKGTIVVTGAGVNTPTAAFVVRYNGTRNAGSVVINNPLVNNDEAAILIVTPRWPGQTLQSPAVSVCYHCSGVPNRWAIVNAHNEISPGTEFNVLVIKTR